jgi:hypothetical protein
MLVTAVGIAALALLRIRMAPAQKGISELLQLQRDHA